jgi:hypothetical protein
MSSSSDDSVDDDEREWLRRCFFNFGVELNERSMRWLGPSSNLSLGVNTAGRSAPVRGGELGDTINSGSLGLGPDMMLSLGDTEVLSVARVFVSSSTGLAERLRAHNLWKRASELDTQRVSIPQSRV